MQIVQIAVFRVFFVVGLGTTKGSRYAPLLFLIVISVANTALF